MTKEELILELSKKPTVSTKEVIRLLNDLDAEVLTNPTRKSPEWIKKGDLILHQTGTKARPHVVISYNKDLVYTIPLTTRNDSMAALPYKTRTLGEGYFTGTVLTVPMDYALRNYVGVFDNYKDLNKAIVMIKESINNI